MLDRLTHLYQAWCRANNLPCLDARDLALHPGVQEAHLNWLHRFSTVWAHFER